MRFHGALLEVAGIGVLLSGRSGAGKSECALELVTRGYRLVADDAVDLAVEGGRLWGRSAPAVRDHIEIRGLGILSIPDLYGPDAVAAEAELALVCRLERDPVDPDRTGLEREEETILGVAVPRVTLAAHPYAGASTATLVDAAIRDTLRRRSGTHGAQRFDDRLRTLVRSR
jgi:HPr kinase/phosphorylase